MRESALYEFLGAVSAEYSSGTSALAGAGGGAGGGGQALRRGRIESSLAQRSLTLVGAGARGPAGTSVKGSAAVTPFAGASIAPFGGVDARVAGKNRKKRTRSGRPRREQGSLSNRRRKRIAESWSSSRAGEGVATSPSRGIPELSTAVLLRLNDMWNGYARSLVGPVSAGTGRQIDAREVSLSLTDAEITGSFVRIARCDACRNLVGADGVVVDVTANTWRVAVPTYWDSSAEKKSTTAADPEASNLSELPKVRGWKGRVVPKRGSALALRIPVGCDAFSTVPARKGGGIPAETSKGQTLCIMLEGT